MRGWLRLDIVRLLLLALPALAVNFLLLELTPTYSDAPERTTLLLVPLLVLVLALALWARRDSTVNLGRAFLFFFPVFCLFFSVATASELLTGRRVLLAGSEQEVPRSFLGLSRLGDWHYRLAPEAPPTHDLLILTLPSFAGELRAEVRRNLALIVSRAVRHGARGLAFDYFLQKESPSDRLLERHLRNAADQGVPVFFGYRHVATDGGLERRALTPSLAAVIPQEKQGHLSRYRESDGRVRMVPMGLGEADLRSLSHRIAESLHGGELPLPRSRLLQYTRPRFGVPVYPFSTDFDWSTVRDRFVLVGSASDTDRFQTPYGPVQGSEIHAFAAHGLMTGAYIHRLDPRLVFPILFAGCYLLTVVYVRGFSGTRLLLAAVVLSGGVLLAAAWAMRTDLLWIDVSYPLVGLWSLACLLLAIRSVRRVPPAGRPAIIAPDLAADPESRPGTSPLEIPLPPAAAEVDGEAEFDVFLSHNSRDKPRVRELGQALVARDLRPWLDELELVPGRSWQDELERIISTVRSSAVLVGSQGLGPWEIPELRASLSESVRRGLPVIPVLLPEAPRQPVLPLFLTQFTWVDLRAGLTEEGLDRLEWGITGVKPSRRRRR